jgi:hypothetical protein
MLGGCVQGTCTPLNPIISVAASTIRVGFLLRFILSSNSVVVHWFVRPTS